MILSVTLNPAVDHTLFVDHLKVGDTNRVLRVETDAGGKGINLSRIAHVCGANTLATGILGGPNGAYLRQVLEAEGVPFDFCATRQNTRANTNIEVLDGGPPTTLNDKGPAMTTERLKRFLAHLEALLPTATWVCVGGSAPPETPENIYHTILSMAQKAGAKTLLDADGELQRQGLEVRPMLIKPNAKEASRLLNTTVESETQAVDAARVLRERVDPAGMVILSRGKDGAVLANAEGVWIGHSPQVEAKSTIGSGDSLLGAFLAKLESGLDVATAFRWGLAGGAATAMSDGSHIGELEDIDRLLSLAKVEKIV
jgi:1-phosphofructokinase family hexose kinase